MNKEKYIDLISTLQQLLKSKDINQDNNRTRVFSEKIAQYLEIMPEFVEYLNEDNTNLKHKFFVEIGRYIKYQKYQKGSIIQHACEGDKIFYMVFTGKILKLNIKYKNVYMSLKEYILFLTKLYVLNENFLYNDCIKKNQTVFPIKENIDIIKFGTKIKLFDFKEELKSIIKKKEEILMNNHYDSNFTKKNKINVNDVLLLYNPNAQNEKNYFLNDEMKFLVNLPFFYIDKIIEPISFLGNLNKNRGIKIFSSFICLNPCDIFYIDKSNIKPGEDELYNLINRKKSEKITNMLFKNHFLFKDTELTFLSKNYSKYFEIMNISKGSNIIHQGNAYDGVFFVIKGTLELKSLRSYNELTDLNYCILNNINLKKINQEKEDKFNDKRKANIINKLIHNPLFIKKSNQKQEIIFGTFSENEIIGLSDLYDKKNGIYNFSVQCLSKEAELFFVPKEIFSSLMTNQDISDKIISLIDEKNKILILKIKKFKDLFELEFDKFLSPDKDKKNNRNINFGNNLIGNSNYRPLDKMSLISKIGLKKEKKRLFAFDKNSNNNFLSKSKSSTDISKESFIPKKCFDINKKYNNYYNNNQNNDIVNQSKNSFLNNNSFSNNELPNDEQVVFHKKNMQGFADFLTNNKSQVFSLLNNSNKNYESKSIKYYTKSKTLNNFFNETNINNNRKNLNKLIKSSSTENISQNNKDENIKKRMEEIKEKNKITENYVNINKRNNEMIIPMIKEMKNKKLNFENNANSQFNNNNNINNNNENIFNILNKKTNNFIDTSSKKNFDINKENDKSNNLFPKKGQIKIKKINFNKFI